jgi:hypothetical protein
MCAGVFLYIQPIRSCSTVRDEILDLPILKLDIINDEVIGLSAVDITKLFMGKMGKAGLSSLNNSIQFNLELRIELNYA